MIRPCPDCPFLKASRYDFHPERAREIVECITRMNSTFQCHHTLDYSDEFNSGPLPGDKPQHCAGALILHEKLGKPSWMIRLAHALGIYDPARLDMTAPVVDSAAEFLKLQTR